MKAELITIPVTMLMENAYILYDADSLNGIIIDPGGEPKKLLDAIARKNIIITAILLTHGHFDHYGGVAEMKKKFDAPVICHADEVGFMENSGRNSALNFGKGIPFTIDKAAVDGEDLSYAGFCIKLIHTPGHTPGGCCYYLENEKTLFSGDTLFLESIGRTDFYLGDYDTLVSSVRKKLFVLPDETIVYPGHEESTSIGWEKAHNMLLREES